MKFPRCVVERISMKYDQNLGAFGTKERNEIWAEVGRNSGLRQAESDSSSSLGLNRTPPHDRTPPGTPDEPPPPVGAEGEPKPVGKKETAARKVRDVILDETSSARQCFELPHGFGIRGLTNKFDLPSFARASHSSR